VQQSDGLFVRRLPAALLREMNIVDTPGAAEAHMCTALKQQTGLHVGLNALVVRVGLLRETNIVDTPCAAVTHTAMQQ
jgi:hypothetical protein